MNGYTERDIMINRPYKLQRIHFDQILFTSDQHFSHNPSWEGPPWKNRGFDSVADHDEWLVEQYKNVSDSSLIISLGDPALNSSAHQLMSFLNHTKAPIWHIWGNHFSNDYSIYKFGMNSIRYPSIDTDIELLNSNLSYEIYPLTVHKQNLLSTDKKLSASTGLNIQNPNTITFLGMQCDIMIDQTLIHLVHMAPLIWTRRSVCCHGHSHGELLGSQPNDTADGQRLDVGVDNSIKYNNTAFFTYEEVVKIMGMKSLKTYDTHK
jgi:calcineurin-like phosphoesterase family protein